MNGSGDSRRAECGSLDLLDARFLFRIRDEESLSSLRSWSRVLLDRLVSLSRSRLEVRDSTLLVTDFFEDVTDFGRKVVERADKVGQKDCRVFCHITSGYLKVSVGRKRRHLGVKRSGSLV